MAAKRSDALGLTDAELIEIAAKLRSRRPQVSQAQRSAELNAYSKRQRADEAAAPISEKMDPPSKALQTEEALEGALERTFSEA